MGTHAALLQATEQLTDEVQRLHMAQTVQRSAYLLLARQMCLKGYADPQMLVADVETMGGTQPDRDWQDGHARLAAELLAACGQPSARRTERRQRLM